MHIFKLALPAFALMALSGCTGMAGNTVNVAQAPVVSAPIVAPTMPAMPTPAQTTQVALASTSSNVSEFLAAEAASQLGEADRGQAANAQFYALQFGRPGAPRTWNGAGGVTGNVTVGPYVRVNNLDCRDFTHSVTVKGTAYPRRGTACREADGRWSVVSTAA